MGTAVLFIHGAGEGAYEEDGLQVASLRDALAPDDFWDWDEAQLPKDAAEKHATVPLVLLYHSRDDEVVPFSRLALYSARLPRATIRPVDFGGHQLDGHLADVAHDSADGP